MTSTGYLGCATLLLGLIVSAFLSGCYVVPEGGNRQGGERADYQEGYYDRDHHRYWHENSWHACRGHEDACRGHDHDSAH